MFDVIVCDPDDGEYKSSALGLFYTAISRATTLGDKDGLKGAIYFTGEHATETRIRRIGKRKGLTQEYTRVGERRRWVDYLQKRTLKTKLSKRKQKRIIKWGTSTKYNFTTLKERIDKYIHDKKIPIYNNNKKKRKTPSSPTSIITAFE